ncbi:MAG: MBOAT family protein [Epsilonproteobacteria bacterium]|nr:MBOAT family protein [Campylobacterota bacterium]
MLFNSYEFIFLFLPITFFIYFYLSSKRLIVGAKAFLVFASLFFYSWWNITYLPLILGSILFNFTIGVSLSKDDNLKYKLSKKTILTFGIICNLLLLGYFKYTDFFISNANLALDLNMDLLHITLPLGISFFTFTQIAYIVDAYRGEVKEMDYLNYSLFVTFFPHLLAGPILHHKEIMPQFNHSKSFVKNYKNIAVGIFLFSIGLFKKVVIADTFAVWATNGFDKAEVLNLIEAWATSLSYTFQLYFDFSGYTDMAIGIALLFNIKFPINFNSPYKATNIQDFWRRWHITLSRFLKDYIYIPLGGNKKGETRTYLNLFLTFLIGGLWHGAGWTFIFWGFLHGVALVVHRAWQKLNFKLNRILAYFITFNFINISWIFFRAKDWDSAIKVLSSMFSLDNVVISKKVFDFFNSLNLNYVFNYGVVFEHLGSDNKIILFFLLFIFVLFSNNSIYIANNFKANKRNLIFILLMLIYAIPMITNISEFLYFDF